MVDKQTIVKFLNEGDTQSAIDEAKRQLTEHPDVAELHYLLGRAYWKQGRKGEAISSYEHAAALDSSSPAVQALELARDIMDFFNPDLLNP